MGVKSYLEINRGSDLDISGFWPSAPGSLVGMDLTGYTMDAIDIHPLLAGHLTLTITDAVGGLFSAHIEWQDDMPYGLIMEFRIRITQGSYNLTTPLIGVAVL